MSIDRIIVKVAVPTPNRILFDYCIDSTLNNDKKRGPLRPGSRVIVPFGKRSIVGIIVSLVTQSTVENTKLKSIAEVIDSEPIIEEHHLNFYLWSANYYHHPIGDALFKMLPSNLRKGFPIPKTTTTCWKIDDTSDYPRDKIRSANQIKLLDRITVKNYETDENLSLTFGRSTISALVKKKVIIKVEKASKDLTLANLPIEKQMPKSLTKEQLKVFTELSSQGFSCNLIDGVTGSGKTEIYLQFATTVLKANKQVLILVPEINLIDQITKQFTDRFNLKTIVFHSNISDKERLKNWTQARNGDAQIIIGTRSSIFIPTINLGLIVVDEEHDQSYKQQDGFSYSARDLAIQRASNEKIPVILGSATPSLETIQNCKKNKYKYLEMTRRISNTNPTSWKFIDLKTEIVTNGISSFAIDKIRETLKKGKQALIFINRRGYAPALICNACNKAIECSKCDSKMTLHKAQKKIICHHCDYSALIPNRCPLCDNTLTAIGSGTERIEEYLESIFNKTTIVRVDRDSARKKYFMKDMNEKISQGGPCILIGTQMLAKGHDFKHITSVFVLDTDAELFHPDFKSQERLGQLLTQVAGRGGRGISSSEIFLQTYYPNHPLLEKLTNGNYKEFLQEIGKEREITSMPPFSFVTLIRANSVNEKNVVDFLNLVKKMVELVEPQSPQNQYLGPIPSMLEKRAGRYRYNFQIKTHTRSKMHIILTKLIEQLSKTKSFSNVRWSIDVDPIEL